MGWSESPPFFCAATETARDLANKYYTTNKILPKHTDEKTVMNIDWSTIPVSKTSSGEVLDTGIVDQSMFMTVFSSVCFDKILLVV